MTRALIPEVLNDDDTEAGLVRSTATTPPVDKPEHVNPNAPAVGRWYWITWGEPAVKELVCVTQLGSNYARVQSKDGSNMRVSFDTFDDTCTAEPNASSIIQFNVSQAHEKVHALIGKVQELTARLSLTTTGSIGDGTSDTEALVRVTDTRPIQDYKKALIKAKEVTLPELFKKIEEEHKEAALWMKAQLIPLQAQADGLKPVLEQIGNRIFNVELYAGLVETVEQVKEGKPAPSQTPIHVFQRRHYMDEECLANYEAGGMEFKDIHEFDKWICRKENFARLLPFERTIVAFQVRRHHKERSSWDYNMFVRFELERADKKTFLYMRNGAQCFRLGTEIEFGEQLFPDEGDADIADGRQLYIKGSWGGTSFDDIVPERVYKQIVEDFKRKAAEYKKERLKEIREWEERRKKENAKLPEKERTSEKYPFGRDTEYDNSDLNPKRFRKLTPDDVYYDDAMKFLHERIQKHNRLVLVLQGLLDRSPTMHPHPPWQLYSPEGFSTALRLVYDKSRALVSGEKPDFEKYRAQLNELLEAGNVTIGQEDFWSAKEADKYNDNRAGRYYSGRDYCPEHHFPYGNPGPGFIAEVVRIGKHGARFEWMRARTGRRKYHSDAYAFDTDINVPVSELFNVSAYKPGDFKIFYADPRTRAEYLKWAPFLLAAEDWHAGKSQKKKDRTYEDAFEKERVRRSVIEKRKETDRLRKEVDAILHPRDEPDDVPDEGSDAD